MTKRNKIIIITRILFLSACMITGYTVLKKQLPFLLEIKHRDYLQKEESFYTLYYDGSEEDKVNKLVNVQKLLHTETNRYHLGGNVFIVELSWQKS
ncbi:hypothetical protein V7147_08555 [Bacillus sp. JJ1521]|uniref:hypothetical protein n=1 Tax=Bacillus sp. JJ1521 TaxID=3122957 RepID=UPI002FFEAE53